VLALTDVCNARALSPPGSPLSGSYQTEVESDLGCLSDVAFDSTAAQTCLSSASTSSCPSSCSGLLGRIPNTCRTSIEGNSLYGGQFSLLFSACNVTANATAASAADASVVPPPPPSGVRRAQTQAAGHGVDPGMWLRVLVGVALLCLGAAW
jgi:hypothetical protein